jgi:hypothetical protein
MASRVCVPKEIHWSPRDIVLDESVGLSMESSSVHWCMLTQRLKALSIVSRKTARLSRHLLMIFYPTRTVSSILRCSGLSKPLPLSFPSA